MLLHLGSDSSSCTCTHTRQDFSCLPSNPRLRPCAPYGTPCRVCCSTFPPDCRSLQAWRKSKRSAEDSSGRAGTAPAAGGAFAKRSRDRQVLDDITNSCMLLSDPPDRVVTRSSLRAAQAQVRRTSRACALSICVRAANAGVLKTTCCKLSRPATEYQRLQGKMHLPANDGRCQGQHPAPWYCLQLQDQSLASPSDYPPWTAQVVLSQCDVPCSFLYDKTKKVLIKFCGQAWKGKVRL
jgi:hypothetical protein